MSIEMVTVIVNVVACLSWLTLLVRTGKIRYLVLLLIMSFALGVSVYKACGSRMNHEPLNTHTLVL